MQVFNPNNLFTSIISQSTPAAVARIQGNTDYANLNGTVSFYNTPFGGVLINAEVYGLPGSGFFGMHIHEFGDCRQTSGNMMPFPGVVQPRDSMWNISNMQISENSQDRNIRPPMSMQAFPNTGNHYNPGNVPHPEHAGDLLPLLSNNGYAWMSFYTSRVNVEDIIGRSVVIHSMRDDFTTQPSGNSGDKIGCGVIERM
ncbi:MAG: superoxide dismutase family protein [Lachnospiraceae bacterium]|nr:superoxide dismutase family protein [Lachnospiraceae bacterium]